MLRALIFITALVVLALPGLAGAQDKPETDGTDPTAVTEMPKPSIECKSFVPPEELADPERVALRGVACFEAKKYVLALRHYRRAFEVSESPVLMGAIGRVFQELGYPAFAREYYNSYLLTDAEGKEKIAARLADVEKELDENGVPVRIETTPPDARIFIVMNDDHWELAGEAPLEVTLLPGDYDIIVRREGFVPRETTFTVAPAADPANVKRHVTTIELEDPQAVFDLSNKEWRQRGIAVTIASVPFIAAGTTMIAIGLGKEKDSVDLMASAERDQMNKDASRLKTWGAASFAVGATGIVVGTILYLVGIGDDPPQDSPAEVSIRF